MAVEVGQTFSWQRTFTLEDVEAFARLSADRGTHHLQPDASGRIMVHGLLTATVPTKIGGDLDYIAREMTFEFLRPVFVGDTVRVDAVVTKAVPEAGHLGVAVEFECHNQDGKKVLSGSTHGIIRSKA
jgi:3-hydroxybutyryl-CoA dehydratase